MPAKATVPSDDGPEGRQQPVREPGASRGRRPTGHEHERAGPARRPRWRRSWPPAAPGGRAGWRPRRLSTPYWRSNPVAMPRLTIAVDITARARMPGARKSTGSSVAGRAARRRGRRTRAAAPGCRGEQQRLAAAGGERQLHRGLGPQAAPHDAPGRPRRATGGARGASARGPSPVRRQEHVLEALAPGPQVGQRAGRARPARR